MFKSIDIDKTYAVKEKPFKGLPFKVNYKAKVTVVDNKVSYYVFGLPSNKVDMEYLFSEGKDGNTNIDFNIHIRGKGFGKKMLMRKMLAAQDVIMNKIGN